ncbi:MAG: hypothetical protein A2V88_17690 [Elusimicrobia bacterium RBG_16_66_12]|nr:MAG: hypothetical protein A2V88_17690 [Elusimicrobia bacterium RBG_16_66_12]
MQAIDFIQEVLQDTGGTTYGTNSLCLMIRSRRLPITGTLTRVNGTVAESGVPFWLEPGTPGTGTLAALVPALEIKLNGETATLWNGTTGDYEVNYLEGNVLWHDGTLADTDVVEGTWYGVNAWQISADSLLRSMSSSTVSGQAKSIRLGPLAKSVTGPLEMVRSRTEMIHAFQSFARQWMRRAGRRAWEQR